MFSIQKRFGSDEEIFQLLQDSAREGRESVQALQRIITVIGEPVDLDEFHRLRSSGRKISQELRSAVYDSFMTSVDRGDIDELSVALYKVPKMVDKFTQRLLLSPPRVRRMDFSAQLSLLERATEVLVEMVGALRRMDLEQIRDLNGKLQSVENEADREMSRLYGDLLNGRNEVLEIIALKDLYEQLEKVVDRCRDAGGIVAYIALKNA